MYHGYARLGDVEVWNNNRTLAYLAGNPSFAAAGAKPGTMSVLRDCECPQLLAVMCDRGAGPNGEYISAEIDPAPWFDPSRPESVDFAGMFVEEITPFDSTGRRETFSGIEGGSVGPLLLGVREITVTGWLFGKTCCAAEYGLQWLAEALTGKSGCGSCADSELAMFRCCPDALEDFRCVLQQTDTVVLGDGFGVEISVSETSPGVFDVTFGDQFQVGLLSSSNIGPNDNTAGIMGCFNSTRHVMIVARTGAVNLFVWLPSYATVLGAGSPYGSGWQQTFTVDTNVTYDMQGDRQLCRDELRNLLVTRASLKQFADSAGSVFVKTDKLSVTCWTHTVVNMTEDLWRTLVNVAVIDGPKVVERRGTCCNNCGCTQLKVQFTLASESPYLFSDIEWCLDQATFPEQVFCFDWERDCDRCVDSEAPKKVVEQLVPRDRCGIVVNSDGTWCPTGWEIEGECDFADCLIYVAATETTQAVEEQVIPYSDAAVGVCDITIDQMGSWGANGWIPDPDNFPPIGCELAVTIPGPDCSMLPDPDSDCPDGRIERPIRLIWDICVDRFEWQPVGWDGVLKPGCFCYRVVEVVVRRPPKQVEQTENDFADCTVSRECPIDVRCQREFRPSKANLRAEAAAFFYRAAGSPPFTPPAVPTFPDVPTGHRWFKEIEWCVAQGIFIGYPDGTFRPAKAIVRQEYALAFYRFAGSPPYTPPPIPTFIDVPVSHPFYLEIEWANSINLMVGLPSNEWRPTEKVLRATAAVLFYRYFGMPPFTPPVPPNPPTFVDVPYTAPYYLEVEWMFATDITEGFRNTLRWVPIGWSHEACASFPPAGCNITVGAVQGKPQSADPVRKLVEVDADLFVPDCGPLPLIPPDNRIVEEECACKAVEYRRLCCTFDQPQLWHDSVGVLMIEAGSGDVMNIRVAAYENPFGDQDVPCPCDPENEFWDCRQPCAEFYIPHIPAGSVLLFDSRSRSVTLRFKTGEVANGFKYVVGKTGLFSWFDMSPCSRFCVVVDVNAYRVAFDTFVSIGTARRFLVSS